MNVGQGAIDVKVDEAQKKTEAVARSTLNEDAQAANRVVYSSLTLVC